MINIVNKAHQNQ